MRLPETRNLRPVDQDVTPTGWARVSFVRDAPDGRRFANDSRGFLYIVDRDKTSLYADVATAFPLAWYARLESGFIGFAFHPDFARNGLWYSVHLERAEGNPATPDFIPPGYGPKRRHVSQRHHGVARRRSQSADRSRGRGASSCASRTSCSSRAIRWAPSSSTRRREPGSPDYGLLYTSGSDLGFSNGGGPNANNPSATQRLDSVITAILRIDPRSPSETGGAKGLGDYTIPADNKFQADGDPKTLGEIYAYGFRNAHRLVVGPHGRHAVRRRHRHEPHRRGQHRPERRQLRLDEARRLLGERHDSPRRRAEPALRAARRRAARARPRRVHLSRRDLRPQRRSRDHGRVSRITAASKRCAAS